MKKKLQGFPPFVEECNNEEPMSRQADKADMTNELTSREVDEPSLNLSLN